MTQLPRIMVNGQVELGRVDGTKWRAVDVSDPNRPITYVWNGTSWEVESINGSNQ